MKKFLPMNKGTCCSGPLSYPARRVPQPPSPANVRRTAAACRNCPRFGQQSQGPLTGRAFGRAGLPAAQNLQLELKNLQRGLGLTFIYVTHDQEEALTMSDRIVVMNKGVIEQDDNPDNIYHYPSTKFVAKFIGESNFFDTETETLALRPEKLNLCEEAESEDKAAAHPEPAFTAPSSMLSSTALSTKSLSVLTTRTRP